MTEPHEHKKEEHIEINELPRLSYRLNKGDSIVELEASGINIDEAGKGINFLLEKHRHLTRRDLRRRKERSSMFG